MQEGQRVQILNVHFNSINQMQLLEQVIENLEQNKRSSVVFVNVDVVVKADKDEVLRRVLQESEFIMADGMPLVWFSKWFKTPLPEKISGSDFVPLLCAEAARRNKRLFLVGGSPEAGDKAIANLRRKNPDIIITGHYAPPYGFEKHPSEIDRLNQIIKAEAPDVLIVCLGCPKQERFVFENRDIYQATISVCAGATIDFLAGTVRRCPQWISNHGLEWFYRFLQEPGRLFRRYFIDDLKIIKLLIRYWPKKKVGR